MQPIAYSLILNLATLLSCMTFAVMFNEPWLVVVALLTQTHALERFRSERNGDDDGDDDSPQPMGFTADIRQN